MMFIPHRLEIGGETFVEPDVGPVPAGHIITEPLVRELMRLQTVARGVELGPSVVNHVVGLRSGADVLHAAAEVTHSGLRILCVWIFQSSLFRKEFDHFGKTSR